MDTQTMIEAEERAEELLRAEATEVQHRGYNEPRDSDLFALGMKMRGAARMDFRGLRRQHAPALYVIAEADRSALEGILRDKAQELLNELSLAEEFLRAVAEADCYAVAE